MQNAKVDEHKADERSFTMGSYNENAHMSVADTSKNIDLQAVPVASDITESVGGINGFTDTSIIDDAASGATSVAGAIGEAIVGAVDIATTIQPSVGGGGGGGSSKLDDDDDEKKKKKRGYGFGR